MKNLTRKLFPAFFGWIAFGCTDAPPKTMDLFVGTYTDAGSEGIYRLSFDPDRGELSSPRLAAATASPSYLVLSEDKKLLYSVGEGDSGMVSAFRVEEGRDSLQFLNRVSARGSGPCYVDYSEDRQMVAVANYVSGNVSFYKVGSEGKLHEQPLSFQHRGAGPNESRQEGPHAHCSVFSRDSRFTYVVDLGIDQVMAYPVLEDSVAEGFTAFNLEPGDGPRHLVFHPNQNFGFIVNELSNTVVSVRIDPESGKFEQIDRISTLPDGFEAHSQCADIHISSDGKFLYASNRGHNSIAIFSVSEDARLERIGVEPVRGDWPRNFTFSPDENFLLVANQNSDNITIFSVDKQTGLLTYTGNEVSMSKPVCLKFFGS